MLQRLETKVKNEMKEKVKSYLIQKKVFLKEYMDCKGAKEVLESRMKEIWMILNHNCPFIYRGLNSNETMLHLCRLRNNIRYEFKNGKTINNEDLFMCLSVECPLVYQSKLRYLQESNKF